MAKKIIEKLLDGKFVEVELDENNIPSIDNILLAHHEIIDSTRDAISDIRSEINKMYECINSALNTLFTLEYKLKELENRENNLDKGN